MKNYSINNCKITKQPTEDKYSMQHIRIKGFLPRQVGSVIIMPKEITSLAGSDRLIVWACIKINIPLIAGKS